jgi:hypothetical protein
MKTSELFQRLVESNLTNIELETIELLEESFTDISLENQSDYISIEEYFKKIKKIFPDRKIISSNEIINHIKTAILNNDYTDLLFLDGLNSLAECLIKYGGNDDLKSFENWVNVKVKEIGL